MLALKLIVFTLVISTSVLGRENGRRRQANDEYKYNHPPNPEIYEPIPVAIVYENDSSRGEKSLKSNVTLDSSNITDEVSKDPLQFESTVEKEPNNFDSNNNDEFEIKKSTDVEENEPKVTTYRPQNSFQIPVAVVYEPESTYYQKRRPNANRTTNKRRRTQKPVSVDKDTDKDGTGEHRVAQVNGHTGPDVVSSSNKRRKNTRPVPDNQNIIKNSPPPSLISDKMEESDKTQKLNVKEVKNSSVDKISSNPTVNKKEDLNTKDDVKPIKSEIKKIKEVNRKPPGSQERENSTVISKVDRLEQAYTDVDHQLRKHDNSTRVREVIPIVQSENVVYSHSGNFKYSYEGGDGTKAFEAGELKTFDDESAGEAVSGGFSYTAKDGNEYSLSYTADENGYRPVGAHLPTPPPIPPAIARALAYLATKTTPAPVTESIAEYDQ